MRFLVDESSGPVLGKWLKGQGHELFSVYEQARGVTDQRVLEIANTEGWILITNDKDFGERIFRRCARHSIELVLPVQGLDADEMRGRWRQCRRALLL